MANNKKKKNNKKRGGCTKGAVSKITFECPECGHSCKLSHFHDGKHECGKCGHKWD